MEEILTILVADDNSYMLNLVEISIKEDKRFKIIGIVKDRKEEIRIINKLKPSIVITDLKRGNCWCGLDIIKEVRNNNGYIPIFFVISASAYYYYSKMRELDIKYFLNKPCDNEKILEELEKIYEDVFPKKIINIEKNREIETDSRNFFNKLLNKLKKRMS